MLAALVVCQGVLAKVREAWHAQSTVAVSAAAANWGWIPLDTDSDELSTPLSSRLPAPEESVPMPKCVQVAEPPVHCGNWTSAVLEMVLLLRVQPPAVRATATRA